MSKKKATEPIIVYRGSRKDGPERMALHPDIPLGILPGKSAPFRVVFQREGRWIRSACGADWFGGPVGVTTTAALAWLLEGEEQ